MGTMYRDAFMNSPITQNLRSAYNDRNGSLPTQAPQQRQNPLAFNPANDPRSKLPFGFTQARQNADLLQQDVQAITDPNYQDTTGAVDTGNLLNQLTAQAPQEQPPVDQQAVKQIQTNPTNGQKTFTQEHVDAGHQGVDAYHAASVPAPTSPDEAQQQAQSVNKVKADMQQVAAAPNPHKQWQKLQREPFYKDSNFYTGMMNVGLAIMSGANPMQAFQAGKAAEEESANKQEIGQNEDVLRSQGYSEASIAKARQTGDINQLQMRQLTPEEKAQQEKDQQAQANAEWDRRNSISQQFQIDKDKRDFAQQKELEGIRQKTSLLVAQGKQDIKDQANAGKTNMFGGIDQRSWNTLTRPTVKRLDTMSNRSGMYAQADTMLDRVKTLYQQGKYKEAGDAFIQARESMGRGILGSNAMLDKERYEELTKMSDLLSNSVNSGKMQAGFGPSGEAIDRMKGILDTDRSANEALVKDNYNQLYASFRRGGMDADKAAQATSAAFTQYPGFDADTYSTDAENLYGGAAGQPTKSRGSLANGGKGGNSDTNGF